MVDATVDGLMVAFAGWTLLYEIALAVQRSIRWAAWPWLAFAVVCVLVMARPDRGLRHGPVTRWMPDRASARGTMLLAPVLIAAILLRHQIGLLPLAAVAIVILVVQLAATWRVRCVNESGTVPETHPANGEHLLAVAGSLGLAVIASLLLRPDADDAYYVNRATWIEHHGVPVTGDTMFGPGRLEQATDGGLPTPSVEALQGALAHALHVSAPGIAYLLWVPVVSAVLGWTLWRLVRAWAPRRRPLVFAVAVLFLLASGNTIVGDYSIGRIWQGKVAALAVLVPLVWVYLTRLATGSGRREQLLLGCAGVAFVGLTTTSALLVPVVAGAAVVAAFALRSRTVLVGGLLLVVAPVVNGIVEKFGPVTVNPTGTAAAPADRVFAMAFGSGAMAALAVGALVLAPRIVPGPARPIAAAIALVTMLMFVPGMLALANGATGAGPVIWRLAVAAPVPVLVGLLAAVDLTRFPRLAGAAATIGVVAVVAVVVVVSGAWLWSGSVGGGLTSHPTWKVDQAALADVRAAQRLTVAPGRWLLPEQQMTVLSISTAGPYAVVPRAYYLTFLDVPHRELQERRLLLHLVQDRPVAPARVARALRSLNVTLACVPTTAPTARTILASVSEAPLRQVGSMSCLVGATGPVGQMPST